MGLPFLEQDTGSSADITSELLTGSYTASSDGMYGCSFRISSMNGAAATVTARLAHTDSGDTLIRNWYFSKAKHTAANTVFGDEFAPVAVKSGEKLKLYLLSSNANDSTVSWQADWISGASAGDLQYIKGDAQSATDLKDFVDAGYDPATNKVEGVKLVDTTTTNTDMVGTDGALLAASVNVSAGIIEANVLKWKNGDVAVPTQAGIPEVDVTYLGGSAIQASAGYIKVSDGTGAGQISLTNGKVELTNEPSNLADLAITAGTGKVTVGTNDDKTGYCLASDGLDSISTTQPSGVAGDFREMMVQIWRRFFKKSTLTSTQLKTYKDDGSTVATTQSVSDDGSTQTQDAVS